MKLATSSVPFDGALAAGSLTQLEWLDVCARELDVEGVVFEERHFPRRDPDYVAQLKKMAADLGLTVAALRADLVGRDGDEPGWAALAAGLGAPLAIVSAPAADDDPQTSTAFSAAMRAACGEAKRVNVTLAVRNEPGTLCASSADLKGLAKDVDSAWLRFALNPLALDPPEAAGALLARTVIAIHEGGGTAAELVAALRGFRGFVLVCCAAGADAPASLNAALAAIRAAGTG
jgi:sugar phosphate isomerase/epimerase